MDDRSQYDVGLSNIKCHSVVYLGILGFPETLIRNNKVTDILQTTVESSSDGESVSFCFSVNIIMQSLLDAGSIVTECLSKLKLALQAYLMDVLFWVPAWRKRELGALAKVSHEQILQPRHLHRLLICILHKYVQTALA